MWSTVLLLLLMAMFRETYGEATKVTCSSLENTRTPCCTKPKPLRCAYLSPLEAEKDQACNCHVPDGDYLSSCGTMANGTKTLANNFSIPCAAYYERCSEVSKTKPPELSCMMHYPPQAEYMPSLDFGYCTYNVSVGEWLPRDRIYTIFFTCWIYRCDNRLVIPERTRAKTGALQWCYPPVLPEDEHGPKYCPLYTTNANNLHEAIPFRQNVSINPKNRIIGKGCVLPPVCDEKGGKINKSMYMVPWVRGVANETYCESLCEMLGPNNGKVNRTGQLWNYTANNECRMRPTCGNEKMFNRFQIPDYENNCRKRCEPDSDFYLAKGTQNFSDCNPLPLCKMVDGEYSNGPDEPFSVNNPYGEPKECIIPIRCTEEQSPDTHHCIGNTIIHDDDDDDEQQQQPPFPFLFLYISLGVVCCLLLACGCLALICIHKTMKHTDKEAPTHKIEDFVEEFPSEVERGDGKGPPIFFPLAFGEHPGEQGPPLEEARNNLKDSHISQKKEKESNKPVEEKNEVV